MTLWQNKSKTLESIKEAKAQCNCCIKEAEAHCSLVIQEVESFGATQACSIQQSHAKDIQHLEEESLEEERRGQLNFLSACQATLDASLPESHDVLITPYHLLLGYMLISNLLPFPQEHLPLNKGPSLVFLPLPPLHLGLCPDPSCSITNQTWWVPHPLQDHIQGNSLGAPLSEAPGGDAASQGIDEKPSRSIQPRLLFSEKGQGGILQEPLPGL